MTLHLNQKSEKVCLKLQRERGQGWMPLEGTKRMTGHHVYPENRNSINIILETAIKGCYSH